MKAKKIKELMITLSDYATVPDTENLAGAIRALKQSNTDKQLNHKHRAVLVYDTSDHVIGKVGIREILKALEPKYRQFASSDKAGNVSLTHFGFNQEFLSSLVDKYSLWHESMETLVAKAAKTPVKDIMYTPSRGEYVNIDAPVSEAVHQFIIGCHQSLLVVEKNRVKGILRLADLFDIICDIMP
ncbi:MAG: CBS domain-containing protein [Desulfotignum sp.]|nr:CBS domain-containing protein [Desulfotignum sp.]MCF8113375.1 CBS domain-containing protein [Desulfotignum sp.]MCF8125622.1 CBS domain-containing protein [Desulfotignum sp.]